MHAMNGEGDAEQQKRLTSDIWNAIVRNLVSTMYAHVSQPNKNFCTQVAKQLVEKYSCMRDAGTNVIGQDRMCKFINYTIAVRSLMVCMYDCMYVCMYVCMYNNCNFQGTYLQDKYVQFQQTDQLTLSKEGVGPTCLVCAC